MLITIQDRAAVFTMDAAVAADGIRQMIADIKIKELLGGLTDCRAVTVDLSATERVDADGLLFLCALCKKFAAGQRRVRLQGGRPALREVLTAAGLGELGEIVPLGGAGNE